MFSIWDNAKESAPMFLVDDHVELLATQYSTRRMAGIVEDVFDDWSRSKVDERCFYVEHRYAQDIYEGMLEDL